MKAVRVHQFGGPGVLQIEEFLPKPTLGENQILVKVYSAGINPVDTYIRSGTYTRLPKLPYIVGNDGAGVLVEMGPKTGTKFKIGDRVFFVRSSSGSHAEFCAVSESNAFLLPTNAPFSHGAAAAVPYFTSFRALFQKAKARMGQTVLVHGASGACGIAAVQLAKAAGLRVFGTAGTVAGRQLVKSQGGDAVFDHNSGAYLKEIMHLTKGVGVDIVVEMASDVNLAKDLTVIGHNATVVVVGCRGPVEINPRFLMTKEAKIAGVALNSATDEELQEIGTGVQFGLEKQHLRPVIRKFCSMPEIAQAHRYIVDNGGAAGKLILKILEDL